MQNCSSIQPGFAGKALRKGWNIAVRQIELNALHAMHGEKDHIKRERFFLSNKADEIFERCKLDATYAESLGSERQDGSPEFFAWIAERGEDDCSCAEGQRAMYVRRIVSAWYLRGQFLRPFPSPKSLAPICAPEVNNAEADN